jgi:hypothetical protein
VDRLDYAALRAAIAERVEIPWARPAAIRPSQTSSARSAAAQI